MALFSPMNTALSEAAKAAERGEVPVGAVLVHRSTVIAQSGNRIVELSDPTAHAELLVIRMGCALLDNPRLQECDLYVTLEPCAMCAQAISFARIRRLYFGAYDVKGGGVENGPRLFQQPTCHHRPEVVGGISEKECAEMLQAFFKERR